MHFVPIKSIEQQDIQCLHRVRSRLVQEETALVNQIRGLLAEYGIVIPQSMAMIRKRLPEILGKEKNGLTPMTKEMFSELYEHLLENKKRVENMDIKIIQLCKQSKICQRLGACRDC